MQKPDYLKSDLRHMRWTRRGSKRMTKSDCAICGSLRRANEDGARREPAMRVCAFLNRRGGQVLFGVTRAGEK